MIDPYDSEFRSLYKLLALLDAGKDSMFAEVVEVGLGGRDLVIPSDWQTISTLYESMCGTS